MQCLVAHVEVCQAPFLDSSPCSYSTYGGFFLSFAKLIETAYISAGTKQPKKASDSCRNLKESHGHPLQNDVILLKHRGNIWCHLATVLSILRNEWHYMYYGLNILFQYLLTGASI